MIGPRIDLGERYRLAARDGRPLIGAHRGDSEHHPENTMAAFLAAIDLGCDLIECDVHLSADGELIVIHDHTLDRTTNGTGLVMSRTAAELRRLDAGQGQRLPTLDEVCEAVAHRAALCVELKQLPIAYPDLEARVVETLARHDLLDDCSVISFRHASIARVRELEPRIQVGVLMVSRPVDPVAVMRAGRAQLYCPHWSATDPELLSSVRAAGGRIGTWTVDDDVAVSWTRSCMPDSLFSNRPEAMLREFAA